MIGPIELLEHTEKCQLSLIYTTPEICDSLVNTFAKNKEEFTYKDWTNYYVYCAQRSGHIIYGDLLCHGYTFSGKKRINKDKWKRPDDDFWDYYKIINLTDEIEDEIDMDELFGSSSS